MSELAKRLRRHVLGPDKCPACGESRNEMGCGEPCSYSMDYGTHSSAFDDPWKAKEDMLEAADRIERLEAAIKRSRA